MSATQNINLNYKHENINLNYKHEIDSIDLLKSVKDKNNEETINRIQKLVKEGTKICLFIGRSSSEEIPLEKDTIWVSLDPDLVQPEELSPQRYHLILSCNDQKEMSSIQHLFSKVIVDQSTWKFFDAGIIDRLAPLLNRQPESSLIFESAFQFVNSSEGIQKWEFDHIQLSYPLSDAQKHRDEQQECFKKFIEEIGGQENLTSSSLYQEFFSEQPNNVMDYSTEEDLSSDFETWLALKKGIKEPSEQYIPMARKMTVEYLSTLFDKVELKLNTAYPYPTRYSEGHDNFFVATGPKN